MEPNTAEGTERPSGTSCWQLLFVLPALGTLGLGALLPLWGLVVTASTGVFLQWCRERLLAADLRDTQVMDSALPVALGLLLGALGAALLRSLRDGLHELTRREDAPPPPRRGGPLGWLWRHPWWTLGLGLLLLDFLLLRDGRQGAFPVLAATVILARTSWLILTVTLQSVRLALGCLGLGWRLARQSAFKAGLLVAGGGVVAVGWLVLLVMSGTLMREHRADLERARQRAREELASLDVFSRPDASSQPPAVSALFERGALPPDALPRLAGWGASDEPPEAPAPTLFSTCAEGLGGRLRADAEREAALHVDPTEAPDVVQDVLLRVCLRGRHPSVNEGYFLRSVQRRAREWRRRAPHGCPLVTIPEQTCALRPDEEQLAAQPARAVNKALCTLSGQERWVLRLRLFEQRSDSDLAVRLGVDEDTARQRVSRALRKLEEAFQRQCP